MNAAARRAVQQSAECVGSACGAVPLAAKRSGAAGLAATGDSHSERGPRKGYVRNLRQHRCRGGRADWWRGHPEAYQATRTDLEKPEAALPRYVGWLRGLPGKPVFVAYPAGFDFLFVYWYLMRFAGESPFSFSALDIKSYAMALLKTPFRQTVKKAMPGHWFDKQRSHTHVALDDARGQGALFCNMLAERSRQGRMHTP